MTNNYLLVSTKGMSCLSDFSCCPGFICSKDNAQQKGFCSSAVGTKTITGGDLETQEQLWTQGLGQLVSILIYIVKNNIIFKLFKFLQN